MTGEDGPEPRDAPEPDRAGGTTRAQARDEPVATDPTGPTDAGHAADDESRHGRRWVRRAGGDRRARARLRFVEDEGVIILNDRRIPGSRAAIKYLVVGPAGVFVVDAKDVKGLVHTKRPGPMSALGPDELHVGRHNCTPIVGEIAHQVEVVRTALRAKPWATEVPVHAMLCLTRAEWGFASPIELGEVWVGWPQLVRPRVKSPVVMDSPMVNEVSLILADRLPRA
jgi:hypothetical protein